jgi:penicillin-binding protein 1C
VNKSGTHRRHWGIRRLSIAGTALAAGALCLLIAAQRMALLPPDLKRPAEGTLELVDCRGRLLASIASPQARAQSPLPLGKMGRWLPAVTVALEDRRFRSHCGVDPYATAAALWRNVCARRMVSGASTITQQVIKLAYGRSDRSWGAKLYENVAALRLERSWSKDRILEEYLNRNCYGNRLVGPAAAARAYFRKRAENLTLPEAIYLAGLPQAPSRFNPWRHPVAAAEKYRRSVQRLATAGFLKPEEATRFGRQCPAIIPNYAEGRRAPHFVDAVLKSGAAPARGRVATTLDLDLQKLVESKLAAHLERLAARHVTHGAVVVIDCRTGGVRAMVGSRSYAASGDGQINGTTIFRSCGSTLKPFLYLRAIADRVLTAATLLPDTQDAVRAEYIDYDPLDYDKRFLGPVRVREALASSLNVPAVVTLSRVGARKAFLALQDCGLRFARPFTEYGAGLILGNAEVRLLDLTAAYTLFSGDGVIAEPRLLASQPSRHRYVAPLEAVAIVGDILSDNEARRKTFGPFSPLAFENHRIPCKTGTSSGFRDACAVGVTAEHAVGVWVGNFDGRPMEEIAAVTGAAPLWHEIVEALLEQGDTSVPPPVESARLTRRAICQLTGLLPVANSPSLVNEWFLAGTEPREDASRYWQQPAGCDAPRLFLPREYTLWCHSAQNYLQAEVAQDAPLRIISPAQNATFLLDPDLPRSQQAIRLLATSSSDQSLTWTVDGQSVPSRNGAYFWPLAVGRHSVQVATITERAQASFTVE